MNSHIFQIGTFGTQVTTRPISTICATAPGFALALACVDYAKFGKLKTVEARRGIAYLISTLAGSVLSAQGPQGRNPKRPLLYLAPNLMRTIVYVDGFNLYYRLLEKRPALKWLNIKALAERLLRPVNVVVGVRYYSARISGRLDSTSPARQQLYLEALRTVPEISIHMGTFLTSEKFAGLARPPEFRPRIDLPQPWPDVVKVVKVEEKGSDVNLACHLLLDAFQSNFDVAAVISNDSDLVEPIRIATQVLGKPVGLLSPVGNPNPELRRVSSFIRRISVSDMGACQFADQITRSDGSTVTRPAIWV